MNISNGYRKSSLISGLPHGQPAPRLLGALGELAPWLQLTKLPLCLLVAFSCLFGSVLAGPVQIPRIVLTTTGMLLLACGCATLNSLQEIRLDTSMARTKDRPLPQGRISVGQAAVLALSLITSGLSVLYLGSHLLRIVGLSLVAVVLYNLIYTPLKAQTVAAIIPGAMSGALPSYIGWSAAGGEPLSGAALLLCTLFILWQVPHSLLVLLSNRDDYLDNALPSLVKILPESALQRIFITWLGAFFTVLLLLIGVSGGLTDGVRVLLQLSAFVSFLLFCIQLRSKRKPDYHFLFFQLNFFLFSTMAILTGDRLFFSLYS